MPRVELRAQGEADLTQTLLREVEIRHAIEAVEKELGEDRARRQLLGTAIRLTQEMAPDLHETVRGCGTALGLAMPVETYVYPDPFFNAGAVLPARERYLMVVSSSLVEAFDDQELRFVVGHELGHFLFEHHRIPVAALLGGAARIRPGLALQLFAWQRYAEVSADRAGAVCAGSLEPAARALFKLASGLRGGRVEVHIDQFLAQVGDIQQETFQAGRADESMRPDWFATHPFSPLRLKAAEWFSRSELMLAAGTPRAELEAKVQELMTLMEPSYLIESSAVAETMRRLLFAGGVAIAAASGKLDEKAVDALERLLGPGSLPSELKPELILADLPSRIRDVRKTVPPLRRAQVIRDLCVIARADGRVNPEERAVMRQIAEAAEVDASVIHSTMEGGFGCEGVLSSRAAR